MPTSRLHQHLPPIVAVAAGSSTEGSVAPCPAEDSHRHAREAAPLHPAHVAHPRAEHSPEQRQVVQEACICVLCEFVTPPSPIVLAIVSIIIIPVLAQWCSIVDVTDSGR
jgi:hypothetical protein